jgi:hypothetical protein
VIQRVFDLNGRPLEGQDHGVKDKTVMHNLDAFREGADTGAAVVAAREVCTFF